MDWLGLFIYKKIKGMMGMLFWEEKHAIERIERALWEGKVVAGTSDTVLGLLATPTQTGFEKLNSIKERTGRPYLILIGDKKKGGIFCGKHPKFSYRKNNEFLLARPPNTHSQG